MQYVPMYSRLMSTRLRCVIDSLEVHPSTLQALANVMKVSQNITISVKSGNNTDIERTPTCASVIVTNAAL
jgi:hypothetical protein